MTVPTYTELFDSIISDFKAKFGITSLVGKVVFNAFAAVQAAKLKIIYLSVAFVYKNIFPDTADSEALGGSLERFGLVKLDRLPFPATAGEYKITVTGTIGATIPAGTTYKSLDTSTSPDKLFRVDSEVILASTSEEIDIRALDLGSVARLEVGDELQVTAPIDNVNSFASVASVEVIPVEAESIEDYRTKVIAAYQLEAQGGAKTDYRIWSADAAGEREVYPYVVDGEPGKINLYIEANADDSTDGHGTPTAAIIQEVEDVVEFDPDTSKPLNERGRRPMGTFEIFYLAITPLAVDVQIFELTDTSFLSTIKDTIETFLLDIRPFIDGADNPNNIQKDKLFASDIVNIVRSVIGSNNTFSDLKMFVDSIETTLYQFTDGDIPYIDTVVNVP